MMGIVLKKFEHVMHILAISFNSKTFMSVSQKFSELSIKLLFIVRQLCTLIILLLGAKNVPKFGI